MDRKVWAFALVGVAAVLRLEGRRIVHARVTLGGVAPIPWRARAAESLLRGAAVDPDGALFERAAGGAGRRHPARPQRLQAAHRPHARAAGPHRPRRRLMP